MLETLDKGRHPSLTLVPEGASDQGTPLSLRVEWEQLLALQKDYPREPYSSVTLDGEKSTPNVLGVNESTARERERERKKTTDDDLESLFRAMQTKTLAYKCSFFSNNSFLYSFFSLNSSLTEITS